MLNQRRVMVLLRPVLVLITAANIYHINAESIKDATTTTTALSAVSLGLGCYADGEPRDLGGLDESGNEVTDNNFYPYTGSNKPETCISYCNGKGFKYSGVQYSKQCFCGNSYGMYGTSDSCIMPCSGDESRTCGGAWANFIYATAATTRTAAASTAATSISAPTAASLALGCYTDGEPRDLGGLDGSGNPTSDWRSYPYTGSNTPEKCIRYCQAKGFKYAGVQYGMQCFCGNSYSKYGSSTNCNMPCSGDSSKTCGGNCANFVYATSGFLQ